MALIDSKSFSFPISGGRIGAEKVFGDLQIDSHSGLLKTDAICVIKVILDSE